MCSGRVVDLTRREESTKEVVDNSMSQRLLLSKARARYEDVSEKLLSRAYVNMPVDRLYQNRTISE